MGLTIDWENSACMLQLKYVDLRSNLLTDIHVNDMPGNTLSIAILSFFSQIETLLVSYQWYTHTDRSEAMWVNDDQTSVNQLEQVAPINGKEDDIQDFIISLIGSKNKRYLATVKFIFHYKSWVKFVLNQCFNLQLINVLTCCISRIQQDDDVCDTLHCLPTIPIASGKQCRTEENKLDFILNLLVTECKMKEPCAYKFPIPLLPKLRHLDISYFTFQSGHTALYQNRSVCVFSENNLEWLDVSHVVVRHNNISYRIESGEHLTGLKKLKYLNLQNTLQVFNFLSSLNEILSLEELHLSHIQLNLTNKLIAEIFSKNLNLKTIQMTHTLIDTTDRDTFSNLIHLQNLDLSNNNLNVDTLNVDLSRTNLTQLILHGNQLSTLSDYMTSQLSDLAPLLLDLTGNPLLCDCSNIQFVEWAQDANSKHKIQFVNYADRDKYICKGSSSVHSLFTVDVGDLRQECDQMGPVVIAVSTTLVIVATVALIVLAYRKRWHLRHFLFKGYQRLRARGNPEEVVNYEYDAFILYSGEEEDRLWVHRVLVDTLEKEYGLTLHIHLRDFPLGEYISDNIAHAIKNSRKIVAIISPNFLHSHWCL